MALPRDNRKPELDIIGNVSPALAYDILEQTRCLSTVYKLKVVNRCVGL